MAEVMMQLGQYVFSLDTAPYETLTRTRSWCWCWCWRGQNRISHRPAQQYTGLGMEQITLKGVIYPCFKGG